ncbi:MAG: hypothetical protein V3V31_10530 [Methylococcales bacterium]
MIGKSGQNRLFCSRFSILGQPPVISISPNLSVKPQNDSEF